jgi:succinate-semialdehyde dehydrogenase/glutarate-semialdehyde dehydrogenase
MTAYPQLCMIVDGERIAAGGRRTFTVRNPATGDALGEVPLADAAARSTPREAASRSGAIRRRSSARRCCRAPRG